MNREFKEAMEIYRKLIKLKEINPKKHEEIKELMNKVNRNKNE